MFFRRTAEDVARRRDSPRRRSSVAKRPRLEGLSLRQFPTATLPHRESRAFESRHYVANIENSEWLENGVQRPVAESTRDEPQELEAERQVAIHVIEQHQRSLQEQQEKLSRLLDNAIHCLKNLDSTYHQNMANNNTAGTQPEDDDLETHLTNLLRDVRETSIGTLPPAKSPLHEEMDVTLRGSQISALEDDEIRGTVIADSYDNTPTSKIMRALHQVEPHLGNGKADPCPMSEQKPGNTIYEPNRSDKPLVSHKEPPVEKPGFMDGIRQRGTLMNQTTRVPICEQCKQAIRGPFVLAAGLTWCPDHFKCANASCGRRLLDSGFVEENGQKYCEKCFETLIAPVCNKCGSPITADCLTALQKQWHPDCFVCAHCHRPFGNAAFYLENGQPYCEQDWNSLFTTKCIACKFPIEAGDRWVEAMGSAFHSNCFNCSVCQSNLEGQSFYAKNGLPFCRIHA